MEKIKKIAMVVLCTLLITNVVYGAGYSSVTKKAFGYSTYMSATSNVRLSQDLVSSVRNSGSSVITSEDTFNKTVKISFTSGTSSEIKNAIKVTDGSATSELGTQMSINYSFTSEVVLSYSKKIIYTVTPGRTVSIYANVMGDQVTTYYKHFFAGLETSRGKGVVNVPKYIMWVVG